MDVEYEAAVMRYAADAGWPVPVPLRPSLSSGDRLFSLHTYLPGRALSVEAAAQQHRRGVLLARLHHDLRGHASEVGQRPSWFVLHDLEALRAAVEWKEGLDALRGIRPALVAPVEAAMASVQLDLTAVAAGALPATLAHGDFTRWNLLYSAGTVSGVIDWDLTHLDSRSADLAMARATRNRAVLDGYREEAERLGWPLSPAEEAALAPLDAAMRLGIIGWELLGLRHAGEIDDGFVERQVQRLTAYVATAPNRADGA